MSTPLHPDAGLTLREVFERFYFKDELAKTTLAMYRYSVGFWERLFPENPPVGEITDAMAERFRDEAQKLVGARTVNGYWRHIHSILRRVGPRETGNPKGLGIIRIVPYMRPLRWRPPKPRRVSLEDLSRFYIACGNARLPERMFPASYWWQALIVLAYFTGLRRGDLFSLRMEQIDLEVATLDVTAGKTGKADLFPLHPAVVEHLARIWTERERLFPGMYIPKRFEQRWRGLIEAAGVEHFTLHDIRRTAASEAERVGRGFGGLLLQHCPKSVTEAFYLNRTEELRQCIEAMRVPLAFKHGPNMTARAEKQAQRERLDREREGELIRHNRFRRPETPDPREWNFHERTVHFRGVWYSFKQGGTALQVWQALARAGRPLSLPEIGGIVLASRRCANQAAAEHAATSVISNLRKHLRRMFGLSENWDPVPVTGRGADPRWTILLPPGIGKKAG